jgi:hypothetical protein
MGWSRIHEAIGKQAAADASGRFLAALEEFVRDAVLASNKHVYMLRRPNFEVAGLLPKPPAGSRKDYLAATPPERAEADLSFLLESRSIGSAKVTTFVTGRPVHQSEEIDPDTLTPAGRRLYSGARLVARSEITLRCYDHIVQSGGSALLLIDAPEGVDTSTLSRDEANYATLLEERLDLESGEPIFEDFFPAIDRLWRDDREGIVNWLEFVSNKRAQIRGRFSITSRENYRGHEFQTAGEKGGAQVSPYRIAVKWLDRPGEPMVVLPGRASMVRSGTAEAQGALGPRLSYVTVPAYTTWDDFCFVLDRVRAHLKD